MPTLRITIEGNTSNLSVKLEGRIAGPWVSEFDRTWRSLAPSLGERKLFLDLCGVTYVNQEGIRLLRQIHEETGAEFRADTPLTRYFAEEAVHEPETSLQGGD